MRIITSVAEMAAMAKEAKKSGQTISFVPTMGYLHQGHFSLMEEARQTGDILVASIFVNPMQFGAGEDFAVYPRDLAGDSHMAQQVGVDFLFVPATQDMYPRGYSTFVDVHGITEKMCGLSRPGHFRGVTTVVCKLFNIVQPDKAFFGQKDAQQAMVIRKMVKELNMPVEVFILPTVREDDGLAMSSRNKYLSPAERVSALALINSLRIAKERIKNGERDPVAIKNFIGEYIGQEPRARIDYVSVYSWPDLEEITQIRGPVLMAMAVFIGKTRLIDNLVVEV